MSNLAAKSPSFYKAVSINNKHIVGLDAGSIDYDSLGYPVHHLVVPAFVRLRALASQAGFDLAIVSAYRDFHRQAAIWNAKLSGQRPVLDSQGCPVALGKLSPWQRVEAVLRWSALPGASRHHWGTDLDIYDRSAVADDYDVQLIASEVTANGPFAAMHDWLDQVFVSQPELGFFRPYPHDRGGIAPERWHISFAPVSAILQRELSKHLILETIRDSDLHSKEVVVEHIDEIYRRFIQVPSALYPDRYQLLVEGGVD